MNDNRTTKQIKPITVKDIMARAADKFGENVFSRTRKPDRSYTQKTYSELFADVKKLGVALAEFGIERGDRVAFSGENSFEWAVTYLAVLSGGCVGVPIDPSLKGKEIAGTINKSDARLVIVSPKLKDKYVGFCSSCPAVEKIISMGEGDSEVLGWAEFVETGEDVVLQDKWWSRDVGLDDIAIYLFTSGTTGQSKAAILTQRNLGSNAVQVGETGLVEDGMIFLSLLPLHHTFEATAGMLLPMYFGCSITYARSLKSKEIVEDIRDTDVNVMLGVPLLYEKMLGGIRRAIHEKGGFTKFLFNAMFGLTKVVYGLTGLNLGRLLFKGLREKAGLGTMRFFVSGAAPLQADVCKSFFLLGLPVLQGYGLTESSPVISANVPEKIKFASSGAPLPGIEVRIDNPDENGEGEIIARGDNIFVGYLDNDKMTNEVLLDGWLRTGDSGYLDRDGYIYITGRLKTVIVTASGKNIHPEEVEAELTVSPFIAEVMVLSLQDEATNREIVGSIIFPDYEYFERYYESDDVELNDEFIEVKIRQEVNTLCRKLADYKRVKIISIRKEEFPKTTTRKIKRFLFRDGEEIKPEGEGRGIREKEKSRVQ
ncbi:MAG: AMP-binding protein [bacterium]|nr:AMP-binding protein [bacterium]